MADYQIVDAHAHIFRSPEIAQRAMTIAPSYTTYKGLMEDLPKVMEKGGASRMVLVSPLTLEDMRQSALAKLPAGQTPQQRADAEKEIAQTLLGRLQRHNEWLCSLHKENPKVYGFISMDPLIDADATRKEIKACAKQGGFGIKLHPQAQKVHPNDHRLWPMYETCQEIDFPILSDSGLSAGATKQWGEPHYWDEVLKAFPRLRLVLAHLGRACYDQTRKLAKDHSKVCFDIADIIDPHTHEEYHLSDADMAALIREVGAERVVFGSDFPWFEPAAGIQRVKSLPLSDKEKRLVLGENAVRIYKLA